MPNYTLHYFNGRGRAEILRMMMAMAGVKYMDKRYEFSDWDRCRNGKEHVSLYFLVGIIVIVIILQILRSIISFPSLFNVLLRLENVISFALLMKVFILELLLFVELFEALITMSQIKIKKFEDLLGNWIFNTTKFSAI